MATLPHPPLEDGKRRPEPCPRPAPPEPQSPLTTLAIAINRLKLRDPFAYGFFQEQCHLARARCEKAGYAEIPLLPIVLSESDTPIFRIMKTQQLRNRAEWMDSSLEALKDKLSEDGTLWDVRLVESSAHG